MTELQNQLQATLGDAYTLERELGGGGMSRVWVARDNALGRRVVVKVLPHELAQSVSVERFKREIMLGASLQHPHIVGILSAGETEGLPYFIMPFVEGESLRARLRRGGLSIPETVSIMRDVARALAYAHERGVVHRDIKPDNVMITAGSATVTDFGVAKALSSSWRSGSYAFRPSEPGTITLVGTSLGTPAYMAPEQAAADPDIDHRADIYAFGVMGYEMLVGATPFAGRSPQRMLAAQLTEKPQPIEERRPGVPVALTELIMRCLEKEASKRPQTAAEICAVLDDPAVVSGAFATPSTPLIPALRPPRWKRLLPAAVGVGVLIGVLAGGLAIFLNSEGIFAGGSTPKAAAAADAPKSIVVMPLASLGRDTADTYLADGMTDELTTALSKLPGLRVASRTAAMEFKGRSASPQEIGKRLGVNTLLEGTVQRDGNRLRVTARLVNIADGFTLWSDVYERDATDVFAVQDDISKSIVDALGIQLRGSRAQAAPTERSRGTGNAEAYRDYLRGQFFLQKQTAEQVRKALADFQRAVAKDSGYALAHAGIANAYVSLMAQGAESRDAVWPQALRAASRAVQLDSGLAEGWAARGNVLNADWRWAEATGDLVKAMTLDPSYAPARLWYGENLLVNGKTREALAELKQAVELDPLSPLAAAAYARALAVSGQTDSAIARGEAAVELDPNLYLARLALGTVYLHADRSVRAIGDLAAARELGVDAPAPLGALGYAYASVGDREMAQRLLRAAQALGAKPGAAAAVARIRLGLGDTAQALVSLRTAVQRHDPFFATEPLASSFYDALRARPEFAEIVRLAKLDPTVATGASGAAR